MFVLYAVASARPRHETPCLHFKAARKKNVFIVFSIFFLRNNAFVVVFLLLLLLLQVSVSVGCHLRPSVSQVFLGLFFFLFSYKVSVSIGYRLKPF